MSGSDERVRLALTDQLAGSFQQYLSLKSQAERLRREARKVPDRARVIGDYSSRASSLVTYWSAEVVDEDKALAHFKDNAEVRAAALAAITKLGSRLARHHKDEAAAPPGVKFLKREVTK